MAAPNLDGSVSSTASSTTTISASLTTTLTNDIIVAVVYWEVSSGSAPTVSGVSGGGLTWAKHKSSNGSTSGNIEIWWALAASALSSTSITVTATSSFDDASLSIFGVNGCNTSTPWDTNASLPATYSSATSATPSFSGISTSSTSGNFNIFSWGQVSSSNSAGTLPSGFTQISYAHNGGGARFSDVCTAYKRTTAALSSASFSWGSTLPGTQIESIFASLQGVPPTAQPYWRLNTTNPDDPTQTSIAVALLSLHTSYGGSQAATGGTATASTTNGGNVAGNAFDTDASTYWQSTAVPAQLQYQFASSVSIVEYAITARNDTSYKQVPGYFTLESSPDGTTWTVIDTVADWTWSSQGQTKTYTVGDNYGMPKSALGGGKSLLSVRPSRAVTPPAASNVMLGKAPTGGPHTVSGNITVLGVATAGLIVHVHAKVTGELLGTAVTDGSGNYSVNCGLNWADVYVTAFDPTTYQAIVYDRVAPG